MDEARKQVEKYRTQAFWMMLEIAFIFGIPAFAVLGVGKWLGLAKKTVVISLIPAFVLSWIIVVIRYRSLMGKLSQAEAEVKRADSEDQE